MGNDTLADANALINKGRARMALNLLEKLGDEEVMREDAHYWFQRSLANQLLGDPADAAGCIEDARSCNNWRDHMMGDYHRDVALALIRRGKYVSRKKELDRQAAISNVITAMEAAFDETDSNRQASVLMTKGRREFDLGNFDTAVELFAQADTTWRNNPYEADPQWIMNNNYHWFKALRRQTSPTALVWGHHDDDKLMELYRQIIDVDPNWKRRMAIRLILVTGELGVAIERRFT